LRHLVALVIVFAAGFLLVFVVAAT
jgi:hypothetical protein